MKKEILNKMDLEVYSETLDNGLRIFVVPKQNTNNIYATFSTKYGSSTNEFVPISEDKFIKVPDGIAHFLEHKMFEMEDGTDPFAFFTEKEVDANANTSFSKTTYLFSGKNHFKDNINYLLDYVQKPYFTKKNVEKEKGIIEQEIKMYQDEPDWVMFESIMLNAFVKDPIRYPIAGTVESIKEITKEDLDKCYNTFYHPSNMFVVVTGTVNPEEVISLIKDNQSEKTFTKESKVKVKEYKEPKEVFKEYDSINMDVTIPKSTIAYKIYVKDLIKKYGHVETRYMLSILFDIKIGYTSDINENLINEELITYNIDISNIDTDNFVLYMLSFESRNSKLVIAKIKETLDNLKITKEELERKKKSYVSSLVYSSDNIFSVNSKIMNNIIRYDKVIYNDYDIIKKITYEDIMNFNEEIDLSNQTIYDVFPINNSK